MSEINKKLPNNTSTRKDEKFPIFGKVGKEKNEHIAHNPSPKPIKVPEK